MSMLNPLLPLRGRTIIITRPKAQAQGLAQMIKQQGGSIIIMPVISIVPCSPPFVGQTVPLSKTRETITLFLSANAVHAIAATWTPQQLQWLSMTRVMAIGEATAQALVLADISVHEVPIHQASEGLLQLSALQADDIKACHVIIFCGAHPRPLLAQVLRERGAYVEEVYCYQRQPIHYAPASWRDALQQADSLVCTSQEILQQVFRQLSADGRLLLQHRHLIVISERMYAYALTCGFQAKRAAGADHEAIVQALMAVTHSQ